MIPDDERPPEQNRKQRRMAREHAAVPSRELPVPPPAPPTGPGSVEMATLRESVKLSTRTLLNGTEETPPRPRLTAAGLLRNEA